MLKHEAPLEYNLIVSANNMTTYPPAADLIEAISYSSDNPLFRKPKFRRCLIEYRKYGLYSGRPKKANANIELYYIKIRKAQQLRDMKVVANVKK